MSNEVEREVESQPVNVGGNNQESRSRHMPARASQACDHSAAPLGAAYCPRCGEPGPHVSEGAIRDVVRDVVRQEVQAELAHREHGDNPANVDADLHAEHKALVAAADKEREKLFGKGDTKYRDFAVYNAATAADRAAELRRFGVEPTAPETRVAKNSAKPKKWYDK